MGQGVDKRPLKGRTYTAKFSGQSGHILYIQAPTHWRYFWCIFLKLATEWVVEAFASSCHLILILSQVHLKFCSPAIFQSCNFLTTQALSHYVHAHFMLFLCPIFLSFLIETWKSLVVVIFAHCFWMHLVIITLNERKNSEQEKLEVVTDTRP